MVNRCRVFILGDSLFAETLRQMLTSQPEVEIAGTADSLAATITAVSTTHPDTIIVAETGNQPQDVYGSLLATYPDIPILCANLSRDYVQIITSQRVNARKNDLLTAIRSLPKPSGDRSTLKKVE
jgi:chemotaxis response regulator CheB